jgi:agmatine deiminase
MTVLNKLGNQSSHSVPDSGQRTADLGLLPAQYIFPPEWAPHEATWLSWPHKQERWPDKIDSIYPRYA